MTEKWMSDFQRYAFTFDSLFRRFQSTAVIFNEILSAKRKMVSFSDGLNEYERNESKKETNILVSLLATVSVAVMSYDSHTVVRNPLDYASFFSSFFRVPYFIIILRLRCAIRRLQNIGHFEKSMFVCTDRSMQLILYFEHYLYACAMQISSAIHNAHTDSQRYWWSEQKRKEQNKSRTFRLHTRYNYANRWILIECLPFFMLAICLATIKCYANKY